MGGAAVVGFAIVVGGYKWRSLKSKRVAAIYGGFV
jgi:hypothetical protein